MNRTKTRPPFTLSAEQILKCSSVWGLSPERHFTTVFYKQPVNTVEDWQSLIDADWAFFKFNHGEGRYDASKEARRVGYVGTGDGYTPPFVEDLSAKEMAIVTTEWLLLNHSFPGGFPTINQTHARDRLYRGHTVGASYWEKSEGSGLIGVSHTTVEELETLEGLIKHHPSLCLHVPTTFPTYPMLECLYTIKEGIAQ